MGNIRVTPCNSVTRRATWHHGDTSGTFDAAVTLQHGVVNEVGQQGWAYELSFTPPDPLGEGVVGWHRTFADPGELIYAPTISARTGRLRSPGAVLAALASMVECWAELTRADPGGDYTDLFPESCRDFLAGAEQFALDVSVGWE
jgi:hypothetical protein